MPYIHTKQGTVFYAEVGAENVTNFPNILIHGAASSHLGWSGELRRLAGQRVLTIDLPGHGRAVGAGCDNVEKYADAVLGLMDRLALEKAMLVGHSLGGAIALHLSLHHADRIAGQILIGTGAHLPVNSFILNNILTNKPAVIEKINQWSWAQNFELQQRGLQALETVPAKIIYGDYMACHQFDMRDSLADIHVPTLVIGGTSDKMTPLAYSQFLAEHLPHAILKIVENGGHWMLLEQPKVVADYVAAWVAQTN